MLANEAEYADAGCSAEEIECDDRARRDQPREHLGRGGDLLRIRRGVRAASNGFYEAGRRHGQMLAAREI